MLFGHYPTKSESKVFKGILSDQYDLPEGFLENIILKNPSKSLMNHISRCILSLYSFDEDPDNISGFELIKKGLISEEVRDLDDKYYSIGDFGNRMSYTEDYSRVDSFKRFNYERFREVLESLDFDKYTFGRVRKLK